jgi:hypothetical protein
VLADDELGEPLVFDLGQAPRPRPSRRLLVPPRPEAIVYGVAIALDAVPKKVVAQHLSQDFLEEYPKLNPQLAA